MSNAPQSPAENDTAAPTGQAEPQVERAVDQVRVRRAPKYPVFIFGGIILGIVVTFVAVSVAPGRNDDSTPFLQAFGYFVLYGIAIGAVVGSLVAIVIDAISNRRARRVETERVTVDPAPESDDRPELDR
ncbi:hypothetical protein [Frondihabitans australicus]|uniref:Potassium transporter Trk n=1 Tax=Frondihabitans australicus TaxID=386892 RepID=A0A495IJQ3_9MICO|nr:hypothetical protein [Frondihabitans australicus]RKR76193.1 hypothetical protein C8E83_3358 [Frondihabitans australicus]